MINILIPTKDRGGKLALTLLGIYQQKIKHTKISIIVRDEGETSAMENREVRQIWDLLSGRFETLYIREKESIGLVRSREKLLARATEKYLLWLDDDILLPYNAIKRFKRFIKNKVDFGFVIPIILDADNARNHADYSYDVVHFRKWRALGSSKHYVKCSSTFWERVWRGNGGCMFCKTEKVRDIVKYDFADITTGEGEDMIASILLADKHKCFIDTGIVVNHLVDPSHQWSWAKVAGSLVAQFLKNKVSNKTFVLSGITTAGYKKI